MRVALFVPIGIPISRRNIILPKQKKCLQQTIDSINHVLASSIAVFISFITTNNDSARVSACLIHSDNHLIKYGNLSLISLFGKVYVV
jgi:hypothetical protein